MTNRGCQSFFDLALFRIFYKKKQTSIIQWNSPYQTASIFKGDLLNCHSCPCLRRGKLVPAKAGSRNPSAFDITGLLPEFTPCWIRGGSDELEIIGGSLNLYSVPGLLVMGYFPSLPMNGKTINHGNVNLFGSLNWSRPMLISKCPFAG